MPIERDAIRLDPDLSKEALFRFAREGGGGLRQVEALKELVRRGGDDTRQFLAETLVCAESPSVLRIAAAWALGRDPNRNHQEALLRALQDPDPYVVRRAAESLGRIGDESAAERLAGYKPPEVSATQRAVAFARVLASYRLSLGSFRIPTPPSAEILKIEKPLRLKPQPAKEETIREAEPSIRQELPAIAVDLGSAVELECQGEELLVLQTEDATHGRESGEGRGAGSRKDQVVAVIFKRSAEERHVLYEYVLAHPEDRGFALFGIRPSGALVHFGTARGDRNAASFALRALNTTYSPALELSGRIEPGKAGLILDAVSVSEGMVSNQRRPLIPKRSEIAVPPRSRGRE